MFKFREISLKSGEGEAFFLGRINLRINFSRRINLRINFRKNTSVFFLKFILKFIFPKKIILKFILPKKNILKYIIQNKNYPQIYPQILPPQIQIQWIPRVLVGNNQRWRTTVKRNRIKVSVFLEGWILRTNSRKSKRMKKHKNVWAR